MQRQACLEAAMEVSWQTSCMAASGSVFDILLFRFCSPHVIDEPVS